MESSSWNAWARQVTNEVERAIRGTEENNIDIAQVHQQLTELQEAVNIVLTECQNIPDMKMDIAKLKVKAGIWGLLGGTVPIVIMILFQVFK